MLSRKLTFPPSAGLQIMSFCSVSRSSYNLVVENQDCNEEHIYGSSWIFKILRCSHYQVFSTNSNLFLLSFSLFFLMFLQRFLQHLGTRSESNLTGGSLLRASWVSNFEFHFLYKLYKNFRWQLIKLWKLSFWSFTTGWHCMFWWAHRSLQTYKELGIF